jgi:hypothetical protein
LPVASKQLQKIFVSYHLPYSLIAFANYLQADRAGWLTAPALFIYFIYCLYLSNNSACLPNFIGQVGLPVFA